MTGHSKTLVLLIVAGAGMLVTAVPARAQFAVIDAASVTQLIGQARTLAQELVTARAQLASAEQLYTSMSGSRGMQRLLGGMSPDALPSDWSTLLAVMRGEGGGYAGLAAALSAARRDEALLPADALDVLPPDERASIQSARQAIALLSALAQQSLSDGESRLDTLRNLNAAIGSATDPKGILELQAAIGAEDGVLQNEQLKLQVLHQAVEAQRWADRERDREAILAGQGHFATRFRPTPP